MQRCILFVSKMRFTRNRNTKHKLIQRLKLKWVEGNDINALGRSIIYAYTSDDVARLLGIKRQTVRDLQAKGFKIGALEEICMAYLKRR